MKRQWDDFIEVAPMPGHEHKLHGRERVWKNNLYQVIEATIAPEEMGFSPEMCAKHDARCVWLSIKRLDQQAVHDWRDLQRIKNEILGAEAEAVELYPAESRLVDNANQFHLWCLVGNGAHFPFGWAKRMVTAGGRTQVGSQQRPFYDGEQPADAMTLDEADAALARLLAWPRSEERKNA